VPAVCLVVTGYAGAGVLGVVDRVLDQLANVFVLQLVKDVRAVAPRPYEPCHAQLREVLGHRCRGLPELGGEIVHGALGVDQ
jgi:hypothetical protein